jgi:hypothetical protein
MYQIVTDMCHNGYSTVLDNTARFILQWRYIYTVLRVSEYRYMGHVKKQLLAAGTINGTGRLSKNESKTAKLC